MKHVIGMITQTLQMAISYITVGIIVIFDAIIFGYPILLIYNYVLATKFGLPVLNYIEMVGLVFLYKLLAVLWKSVHIDPPLNNEQLKQQQKP